MTERPGRPVQSGPARIIAPCRPRAERPELVAMYQQHVPFYRSRLLVKPGMTGWAQIHFGYASTIDETVVKLEYDLYYIKHRNLLMDFLILLRTPATVFGLRGQ